jgi:hypothetical protein
VEATDRRWGRVKIFETIIRRLEEALQKRKLPLPEPPAATFVSPEADETDQVQAEPEFSAEHLST